MHHLMSKFKLMNLRCVAAALAAVLGCYIAAGSCSQHHRLRLPWPPRLLTNNTYLADIVVGISLQLQRDALAQPRAQALAGMAAQLDMDGVIWQASCAKALGDLVAQGRADRPVCMARELQVQYIWGFVLHYAQLRLGIACPIFSGHFARRCLHAVHGLLHGFSHKHTAPFVKRGVVDHACVVNLAQQMTTAQPNTPPTCVC